MAITYTWKVTGIKTATVDGQDNVVVQTYWEKTGTDEAGNTGTFTGATPFNVTKVNPTTFVPLEALTEEVVLGWIQKVVVDGYAEHVDAQIARKLQGTTVQSATMPWATVAAQSVPA